jgi:hypothetical protein
MTFYVNKTAIFMEINSFYLLTGSGLGDPLISSGKISFSRISDNVSFKK